MKRQKSFLERYMCYTKETESSEIFHYWSGLMAMSAVLSRGVWWGEKPGKVFPNLYLIFVAPSGVCRKGAAVSTAVDLLDKMRFSASSKDEAERLKINIVREKITPQALTQFLADQIIKTDENKFVGRSECIIYAPELAVFLGAEASANGLLALLTSLYDCPDVWEYKTKTQGTDYLFNTCISIFGASTPVWLFQGIPNDVVGAGFFSRTILIAQRENPRRIAKPRLDIKQEPSLIEHLSKLKNLKGQLQFSRTADEYYENWYQDREVPQDERFMSFFEREHHHVVRVAILLAASYGDLFYSDVISKERLEEAMIVLDKAKETMPLAYEGIGEHVAAKGYDKVLDQIKQKGGEAEHSWLLNRNWYHFDTEGFRKVIDLLVETNRIEKRIKGRKIIYRLVRRE